MHVLGLTDAMDAPHALLKPVGVPRDVVIDHEVAELEVDALPAASVATMICARSRKYRSASIRSASRRLPVKLGDLEVGFELLDQVAQSVTVLGEDE